MREEQARAALDSFTRAVKMAQAHREYQAAHRLNLLLDGLSALSYAVDFLLLGHRQRADEHRRVLQGFARWLDDQDVVVCRQIEGEGGGASYARGAIDDLVEEYLRTLE